MNILFVFSDTCTSKKQNVFKKSFILPQIVMHILQKAFFKHTLEHENATNFS